MIDHKKSWHVLIAWILTCDPLKMPPFAGGNGKVTIDSDSCSDNLYGIQVNLVSRIDSNFYLSHCINTVLIFSLCSMTEISVIELCYSV